MSNTIDLTKQFEKYAGKTLLNPNRETNEVDPVAEQIQNDAKQLGLNVRIEYPGYMFTTDMRRNRLRVGVVNDAGVLKVSSFKIG